MAATINRLTRLVRHIINFKLAKTLEAFKGHVRIYKYKNRD